MSWIVRARKGEHGWLLEDSTDDQRGAIADTAPAVNMLWVLPVPPQSALRFGPWHPPDDPDADQDTFDRLVGDLTVEQPPSESASGSITVQRSRLRTVPRSLRGYSEDQPRDERGRFGEGDGGGGTDKEPGPNGRGGDAVITTPGGEEIRLAGTPTGAGTPDDPLYVDGDYNAAVEALAQGQSIRVDDDKQASILVDKLGDVAREMRERGQDAPDFDLCNVSAGDTNVFCEGNRGIPRAHMPQVAGIARDGSEAATLRKDLNDSSETVDAGKQYLSALHAAGVSVVEKDVPASMLRATQNQLNGGKVGAIMDSIAQHGLDPGQPVYITKDGYLLDGHHRWAAVLAGDLADGNRGDVMMPVREVGMEIGAALDFTNAWTNEFGIEQATVSDTRGPIDKRVATALLAYSEDQPRDDHGRFGEGTGTDSDGGAVKEATDAMIKALEDPDGGFTIDPRTGDTPTSGYAVAYRGMSSITPADDFFSSEEHAADIIDGWLADNAAFFDEHPDAMIGGWHDPVNNEIVLDPALVVSDRAEAVALGTEQNQQAIADLAAIHAGDWDNAFVDTGGTGDREKEKVAARVQSVRARIAEDAARRGPATRQETVGDDARRATHVRAGPRGEDVRDPYGTRFRVGLAVLVRDALDAFDWSEDDHPRDEAGRFTDGGESGSDGTEPESPIEDRLPGVGNVHDYIANHPREPGEAVFEYQARLVNGLEPDTKHALLFEIRERYEPVQYIADGASRYREEHGLPDPQVDIAEIPAPLAKGEIVAETFEGMPDQSDDPEVQAAYDDFKVQNAQMFDFMTRPEAEGGMGITVTFSPNAAGDPYPNATAQAEDLRENRNITIQSGLGGEHGTTMTTEEYDQFRAVHDVFGHAAVGGGFDRHGEYQAYLMHQSMYTGDGQDAMASEYHGVNTAVWAGETGSPGTGKSVLLPDTLIPEPWDDEGRLVKASAALVAAADADDAALAVLIEKLELTAAFARQFDHLPWH